MNRENIDILERERSDKYTVLIACIGFIIFFNGIFNLFSPFNELVNIIIDIIVTFIGFLILFISYMFYFRTRNL